MTIQALFDFYDDHTAQTRELTNEVIAELVNTYGANEDWIDVGSIYYGVGGHLLSVIMDGKPLRTAQQIAAQEVESKWEQVVGLVEPWGVWAERNRQGREEVRYSEWQT